MSTVKISELQELSSEGVTSNDLLQIINVEDADSNWPAGRNRKIKASALANGLATLSTTIPPVIQDALDSKASLEDFNSIGLKIASPVVAASTSNWSLSALVPGASVDGVTLASGNRVLLKDQSSPVSNGVYAVQSTGPAVRATDFDTLLEINDGYVLVNGGDTWKGSGWVVTTTVEEIDVDPIVFTQFSTALTSVTKAMVGLGNVDNTSDAAKPISTATATALSGKAATITGAATTIAYSNLTADRVAISDSSGKVAASTITTEKLGHLSDVTGAIQAQLAAKANLASPTFSGSLNVVDTAGTNNFAIGVKTNGVDNDSGIWTDNNNNVSFDARSGSGALNVSIRSSGNSFLTGGNLGIGINNPSSILHVYGNNEVGKLESSTTQAYLKIQTAEGEGNRVEIANRTGGRMALYNPTSGDVLNILKNGNVGIGISSPSTKFQVYGQARFGSSGTESTGTIAIYNDGNDATIEAFAGNNNSTKRNLLLATYGGNVGIGKSNPATRLDVNGTVTAAAFSGPLTGNAATATYATTAGSAGSCTGNAATATTVSNGSITAAKLDGGQSGSAPICGIRAYAYVDGGTSPPGFIINNGFSIITRLSAGKYSLTLSETPTVRPIICATAENVSYNVSAAWYSMSPDFKTFNIRTGFEDGEATTINSNFSVMVIY